VTTSSVRNVYRSARVEHRREITLTLPDAAYGWGRTQDVDLVLTADEAERLGKELLAAVRNLRKQK
jgi:hypothetical protein